VVLGGIIDSIIHVGRLEELRWAVVDRGYKKHFRVNHGQHEFALVIALSSGIEPFWSYAKRRLVKFNGVPRKNFHLHLKECEFTFILERRTHMIERLTLLKKILSKVI